MTVISRGTAKELASGCSAAPTTSPGRRGDDETLAELGHMRGVADMAMWRSRPRPALLRPPRGRGMGHRDGAAEDAHALAAIVGDWIETWRTRTSGRRNRHHDHGNLTADPGFAPVRRQSGRVVHDRQHARTYNRRTQQYEDGTALFLRCSAWNTSPGTSANHARRACASSPRAPLPALVSGA
ncbi:MAG: hypothetical protein ACLU1W_09025 [Collinsella sp.]